MYIKEIIIVLMLNECYWIYNWILNELFNGIEIIIGYWINCLILFKLWFDIELIVYIIKFIIRKKCLMLLNL